MHANIFWTSLTQAFPKKCFSRDRFDILLSCFHWENTAAHSAAEKATLKALDPFYQVSGLLEQLSDNFQKYYTLGHFYDIDEISVYFKGRHICRCYNPNKPHKWHFKLFGLNCSYTGYLWKFYPYRGAAEKREGIYSGISATAFPVHKPTEPNVLHNKNHILCLDNWYMAPPLARFLVKERGIHCWYLQN